jgi:hypothetical protein
LNNQKRGSSLNNQKRQLKQPKARQLKRWVANVNTCDLFAMQMSVRLVVL